MVTLKILTFNVQGFQSANPARVAAFIHKIISDSGSIDIIAIQENHFDESSAPLLQLDGYTATSCPAERRYRDQLGNSLYIRTDTQQDDIQLLGAYEFKYGGEPRYAVGISYKNVRIVNTHLTGGRFDDPYFRNHSDAKCREMRAILDKFDPHIVLGDFNADFPHRADEVGMALVENYDLLSSDDIKLFREYYASIHSYLADNGYEPVNQRTGYDTTRFGGIVDWVYAQTSMVRTEQETTLFDAITPRVSDHNAVLVTMATGQDNTAETIQEGRTGP